ncbi:hypothetical protein SAMN02982927_03544 [Sporolactobacillus nakayamae]|uniref:Uncharacterized protein n=1 Tax=Sporolactobacillus nakayamae TaxID=269670 RepID=A0A1I2WIV9_9BACL|nr:hypothetical protein SAMN02982927_03544 [Sporolactobacillus nakayamae]
MVYFFFITLLLISFSVLPLFKENKFLKYGYLFLLLSLNFLVTYNNNRYNIHIPDQWMYLMILAVFSPVLYKLILKKIKE